MGRRVLVIVLLLFLAGFAYIGYNSYDARRAGANGDVYSIDPPLNSSQNASASDSNDPQSSRSRTVILPSTDVQAPSNTAADAPQTTAPSTPPAASSADTISPNPPNGTVFSGRGRFQVYRQGNLTWRIDTDTGKTCILFATDEEWRKTRVYRAGCGTT